MKSIALFAIILFFSSCASDSRIQDHRSLGCESGQDIDIMAGLNKDGVNEYATGEDRFEVLINVANNSHAEQTVKVVRIEQVGTDRTRYQIDPVARTYDQLIGEGKDYTFHLPVTGRVRGFTDPPARLDEMTSAVHLAVSVSLANGDSYRCVFDVGSIR